MVRRFFSQWIRLLILGLMAGSDLVTGGGQALAATPCRLPPPGFAAEGTCSWWLNHEPDFVDNTMCCLPVLLQAQRTQDEALVHNARARDPHLPAEVRRRELQLANAAFKKRSELLVQFRDCVNAIIHALNVQAWSGADPSGAIGAACGCQAQDIAGVGWRCCVDVGRSSYQVDLNIATDNATPGQDYDFNCHYYTKMYIHTAVPGVPYPDRAVLSDIDCLRRGDRYGFNEVANPRRDPVHVGDIILVRQPQAIPGCNWAHSGIITALTKNGRPKTIRQKDGPNSCVVDLSWKEFNRSWLNAQGTSYVILSHPNAAGSIP